MTKRPLNTRFILLHKNGENYTNYTTPHYDEIYYVLPHGHKIRLHNTFTCGNYFYHKSNFIPGRAYMVDKNKYYRCTLVTPNIVKLTIIDVSNHQEDEDVSNTPEESKITIHLEIGSNLRETLCDAIKYAGNYTGKGSIPDIIKAFGLSDIVTTTIKNKQGI